MEQINMQDETRMEIEERDGIEYVKIIMPEKVRKDMAKLAAFTAGTIPAI